MTDTFIILKFSLSYDRKLCIDVFPDHTVQGTYIREPAFLQFICNYKLIENCIRQILISPLKITYHLPQKFYHRLRPYVPTVFEFYWNGFYLQ